MKATLRKMGLDFIDNENSSDVGNYRVRAEFTDKNGVNVVADFGGYDRREVYQRANGKTACRIAQKTPCTLMELTETRKEPAEITPIGSGKMVLTFQNIVLQFPGF